MRTLCLLSALTLAGCVNVTSEAGTSGGTGSSAGTSSGGGSGGSSGGGCGGCAQGLSCCGDRCVNLGSDSADCGSCGHACAAGDYCNGGNCAAAPCSGGTSSCSSGESCCGANCCTASQVCCLAGAGAVTYQCFEADAGCPAGCTQPPCPVSSVRYKKDVSYLGEGDRAALRDELLKLPLATFRYKTEPESAPERLGFMVEDATSPSLVAAPGDRVDLYGYATMTVAAVQEQQRELEALRAEVAALKAQLAKRRR